MRGQSSRICVIGAGPSGLTALKNMLAQGLDEVVCYDESDAIGGNWAFTDNPERTSVYESTHIISSRRLSGFEDYPMPDDYPDYPSHRQMLTYFVAYAEHFGLMPHIRLRTQVRKASRLPDGRWSVRLRQQGSDREEDEVFDHLVVCSGHHREAFIPEYPGQFDGEILHSRDFKRAEPFRGKRVLVVGAGNSGADIAVDVGRVAERVCFSMRRGYHFLPKLFFGRPTDMFYAKARRSLPRPFLGPLTTMMQRLLIGDWERYGLQRPTCGPLEMHPTLNTEILQALRHGTVLPRVGIERFDGNAVHFSDGKVETFDTIIWATGFRMTFPFLDETMVEWDGPQRPSLYLRMMHPQFDNLFFIGLFQPVGCIWRLADHQARIVALQIAGRLERPADIGKRIADEMSVSRRNFDSSPRHGIEVDYHDFRRDLMRELDRAHA